MPDRCLPRKSTAPLFRTGTASWQCWITSDGQRFVWRGADDRLLAGKHSGLHKYWSKVDGVMLPRAYPSLKAAMSSAYREMIMKGVRRAG